jgi:hypothetical protein
MMPGKNTFDDEIRASVGPPDMTNQYNTPLTPEQERAFQQTPHANDTFDYDARGEFLAGATRDNPAGHGQDTFKKPNHPTFSTGSQYHGVDGHSGGNWVKQPDSSWVFVASPTNLQMNSGDELQRYFSEREPGNRVVTQQGDQQ